MFMYNQYLDIYGPGEVELPEVGNYVSASEYSRRRGIAYPTLRRLLNEGLVRPDAYLNNGQPLFRKSALEWEDPVVAAARRGHYRKPGTSTSPQPGFPQTRTR